jgi:deazaflavin-dependent oxidoreductase (nitroreductase family)
MWRSTAKLVGRLLFAFAVIGTIFITGMRTKSPFVLNAVRRFGRATKSFAMKSAGTPGSYASVIRHTGRVTGRRYETPVGAVATDDGFVIALPYGLNTDWCKNLLASGTATIVHSGNTYQVDEPQIVPLAAAASRFSPADQRAHRIFAVEQCLQVRRAQAAETSEHVAHRS